MIAPEQLAARPAPLRTDADGIIRVGDTRVRLATVVGAFRQRVSADDIQSRYPSLDLADIYAVITYNLWHKPELDAYLGDEERVAAQVRRQNEEQWPGAEWRDDLLARKATDR